MPLTETTPKPLQIIARPDSYTSPACRGEKDRHRPLLRPRRPFALARHGNGAEHADKSVAAAEFGAMTSRSAPSALRSAETCTLRFSSETTMPGHTRLRSSFFETSKPSASKRTRRSSKARVPSSTGAPLAKSCLRRSSTWKRPNSIATPAFAEFDRLASGASGVSCQSAGSGSVSGLIAAHGLGLWRIAV